jgi:DNA-binding MarR family transcriptional regulator
MTPPRPSEMPTELPTALGEHFEPHVPGIDYGVLDDLVGYSLRRAQIVIYEDFVRTLAPWGITPQRFSALTIISRNTRLKLTELSHILGIARSGAVSLVDALAEMGYVDRVPSPSDKRAYGLVLTASGQRDLKAITQAVVAHDRRMVNALSPQDAQHLMRLLRQVAGPVGAHSG